MLLEKQSCPPCLSPRAELKNPLALYSGRNDPEVHHALLARADRLVRGGERLLWLRPPIAPTLAVRDHARYPLGVTHDVCAPCDRRLAHKIPGPACCCAAV